MKWFKHYSDNHRGQSVNALMDELGYFGPFLYYTIYEICSEKLQGSTEQPITIDDCIFRLHRRVVCSATRARPTSVSRGLDVGQTSGLWSYETDGDYFLIKIPILLELLDSDQKKTRLKRATIAGKKRLDKEEDKDKDKEEEANSIGCEVFSIPLRLMHDLKMLEGYPEKIITEVAKEAWLLYNASGDKKKDWKRFSAAYFKNEKQKIRERILNDPDEARERLIKKYEGSEYEF